MDTLFSGMERAAKKANAPLAARMRPTTLDGYVGQEDAVGQGSWLRKAIEHDTIQLALERLRLRALLLIQRTQNL